MIVRQLEDISNTQKDVHAANWHSRRFLLAQDGMGFSFHDTILYAGTETEMHYQNHLESVYCIEGEGELVDLESGETHAIKPGTLYALNGHERHILKAKSQLRMMCVFNPPLTGQEVHDANGVYPLLTAKA